MPKSLSKFTMSVAPNGINAIVVPLENLKPVPAEAGGIDRLPEANPSIAIELPDQPEDRVSIGIDGREVQADECLVHDRMLYFSVPALEAEVAHGRVSYTSEGAPKLLRFVLRRCATMEALLDSLQAQFHNMTDVVKASADSLPSSADRDAHHHDAHMIQTRIVNAMEPMTMDDADYEALLARLDGFEWTPPQGSD